MTDVLLATALGFAVLGVILIHRAYRRNTEEITRLRAEVTAAKIIALQQATQQAAPSELDEPAMFKEPVRRKRHLALHLGELSPALAWLSYRLRIARRHHRAVAASVVAIAAAAMAAAAAYRLTGADHDSPALRAAPPASAPQAPGEDDSNTPAPPSSAGNKGSNESDGGGYRAERAGGAVPMAIGSATPVRPGLSSTEAAGDAPTGGSDGTPPPSDHQPSTPATTLSDRPTASQPAPPAPPTREPTTPAPPPPTPPAEGQDGGGNADDCLLHLHSERSPSINVCI